MGGPIITLEKIKSAGRRLNVGEPFFQFADAFFSEYEIRVKTYLVRGRSDLANLVPAPDVFLAQLLHETGECRVDPKTKRFWRVVGKEPGDSGLWNPAGIKRGDAESMPKEPGQFETDTPAMFEKPATPEAGARLGYNHKGAYFGLPPLDPVNGRYPLAAQVANDWYKRRGRWPVFISDWGNISAGGVWAGAPGTMYADATRRYLSEFARG